MSMRTCCMSDENKPHEEDCHKKIQLDRRWKEKLKDVSRSTDIREKSVRKSSQRGDRK